MVHHLCAGVDSEKAAHACFNRCEQFISFDNGSSKSVERDGYRMFSLTGRSFHYVCQISDTLVYVSEPKNSESAVRAALKKIGY